MLICRDAAYGPATSADNEWNRLNMKLRKIALWSIAAVISAFAVSALALYILTDSDHLKQLAVDHVRNAWSRDLTIGELSLTFTPMPGFHATNVSLSNPAWAHEKLLFEAKELKARVAFFPLLTGNIVVDRLSINDFKMHLQHAADGRKNWLSPPASTPLPATDIAQARLIDVLPKAFTLRNGAINFRDQNDAETMWQVDAAQLDAHTGWRDVELDLRISRNGHLMQVQARLDDASQLGVKDAISNGRFQVRAGTGSLVVAGELPLDPAMHRYRFKAEFEGALKEAYAFLGMIDPPTVELKAGIKLQAADGIIDAKDLQLQLGKLHVAGDARITKRGDVPVFDARLNADHIDWVQTLLDAGEPPIPAKSAGELFHDNPLPWAQLAATAGIEGTLHVNIKSLKMRSGVELANVTGDMNFAAGRLNVTSFEAKLLGGSTTGSAVLDGARRSAQVNLRLTDALLANWFSQTRKHVVLADGRMQVHAAVSASGRSMKELAASLTGPVTFDIGPTRVYSKKLMDGESLLTGMLPFLSAIGSDHVNLVCIGVRLPFEHGIARGNNIVGVRSDASQLLTGGNVDLRRQTLDLHGPVRARAGIALGVTTFANEVKIDGEIVAPHVGLDKAGAPGAVARLAAAVFTGGASIVGTTLWDSAQAPSNPCVIALATVPQIAPQTAPVRSRPGH
jgi:uncharacterized protein involved in outer membrane biogenesis